MAYVVGEHFITLINVADHLILPLVLSRERELRLLAAIRSGIADLETLKSFRHFRVI